VGPLNKKRHRAVLQQGGGAELLLRVGQRQRRDRHLLLGAQAERRAAGDEQRQGGAGGEQFGQRGAGGQDLLAVVQQEEEALALQVGGEGRQEGRGRRRADAQGQGDRRHDQGGIGNGGQFDQVDAIRELSQQLRGHGQGEARLADAPRSHQRHQPRRWRSEQVAHGGHVPLPPDERAGFARQVGGDRRAASRLTGDENERRTRHGNTIIHRRRNYPQSDRLTAYCAASLPRCAVRKPSSDAACDLTLAAQGCKIDSTPPR
jgi:hypothetical protein